MKKKNKLNLLEFKKYFKIKTNSTLLELKKYFKIKINSISFSSNSKRIVKNSSKSFYYTCGSSLVVITFFFFSPMLINFYKTLLQNNKEIKKVPSFQPSDSITRQPHQQHSSLATIADIGTFEKTLRK